MEEARRKFEVLGLHPMSYFSLSSDRRISRRESDHFTADFDAKNAIVWRARYKFIAQKRNQYGKLLVCNGQPVLEEVHGTEVFSNVMDMCLSMAHFSSEFFYENVAGVPLLPYNEFNVIEELFAARQAHRLMAYPKEYVEEKLKKYEGFLSERVVPKIKTYLPDNFFSDDDSRIKLEEIVKGDIVRLNSGIIVPLSRIDARLLEVAA